MPVSEYMFFTARLSRRNLRGFARGDLHIHLQVKTPVKLNKRQEELLREFAELEKDKKSSQKLFKFWNWGEKDKQSKSKH